MHRAAFVLLLLLTIPALARSASGVLSPVPVLSAAGQNAWMHDLAVNASGAAIFVWVRFDGVQARPRAADDTPGSIRTLASSPGNGTRPMLAVDPEGADWRIYTSKARLP